MTIDMVGDGEICWRTSLPGNTHRFHESPRVAGDGAEVVGGGRMLRTWTPLQPLSRHWAAAAASGGQGAICYGLLGSGVRDLLRHPALPEARVRF